MTLLKTKEVIDLVDLSNFMHEHYDWPSLGSIGSFHRVFADATDRPGQDTLQWIEMGDEPLTDEEAEDYDQSYVRVVRAFEKLIEDGHLPKRNEYYVFVWW